MLRISALLLITSLLLISPLSCLAETHFEAAERLLMAGQETQARRSLELELMARPRNLEARYNLAVLLDRIGHDADAAELYRENIKRGRHLPSVINLSAWLSAQHRPDEAKMLLLQASKDFHGEAVPWYLLADMAYAKGNEKKAYDYYQRALKADEKNAFANLRFARFLAATEHVDAALAQADKAVRLLPSCAPCLKMAGDIYASAGKNSIALALWQKSIAIAPDRQLRHKILRMQRPDGQGIRP